MRSKPATTERRLVLDVINHPERPIRQLVEDYFTSQTTLYTAIKDALCTTPGVLRKRFHKPTYEAVDWYTITTDVVFDESNVVTLFNEYAAHYLRSFEDEPVRARVKKLTETVDGRMLETLNPVGLRSLDNEFYFHGADDISRISSSKTSQTYTFALQPDAQYSTIEIDLFRPAWERPYQVVAQIEIDMLAYARLDRKRDLNVNRAPLHEKPRYHSDLFMSESDYPRCVYALDNGEHLIVTGYDEQLIEKEVRNLGVGWRQIPIDNAFIRRMRELYRLGKLTILDPRSAIRYGRTLEGMVEALNGKPTYAVSIDGTDVRLVIEQDDDPSMMIKASPYITHGPTMMCEHTVLSTAEQNKEEVMSLTQLMEEVELADKSTNFDTRKPTSRRRHGDIQGDVAS